MRISFRQGIVSAPAGFLNLNNNTVDLTIPSPDMAVVAFADGTADYLLSERLTITSAWPGPFSAGAQSYWLYWDINTSTGQRTFGHTLLQPVDGASPPSSPANDQHWFDTSLNKMKVWNSSAARWIPKIRVFAAKLAGGSVFVSLSENSPLFTGTQVGALNNIPTAAGALIFDINGDPIKRGNSFFTTEDVTVAGVASAAQVKLGAILIEAVCTSNIPAYSIVNFTDFNQVSLATNVVMSSGAYGMIEVDAITGDIVNVALEGVISNPLWDWTTAGVNAKLYVSLDGTLTATAPPNPVVVATVVDTNTILLRGALTFVEAGGGGSTTVSIKDEGSTVVSNATSINFTGPNVTASSAGGGAAVVTIAAPAASLIVKDEGSTVQTGVGTINFIGASVTATAGATGVANVTLTTPPSLTVQDEGTNVQTAVGSMNFVGAGVTATTTGAGQATITVVPTAAPPKLDNRTATAAQTVVNTTVSTIAGSPPSTYLQVFRNGVYQLEGVSFNVSGANQITFLSGLALNDQITLISFT